MLKKIIISVILLGGITGGYFLYEESQHSHEENGNNTISSVEKPTETSSVPKVAVMNPKVLTGAEIPLQPTYLGEIITQKSGKIYSIREGMVSEVLVDIGTSVRAGQVVAKLFPIAFTPELTSLKISAEQDYMLAEGKLKAAKKALESFESQKIALAGSSNKLALAGEKLSDASIVQKEAELAALVAKIASQKEINETLKKNTTKYLDVLEKKTLVGKTILLSGIQSSVHAIEKVFYNGQFRLNYGQSLGNTQIMSETQVRIDFANYYLSLQQDISKVNTLTFEEQVNLAQRVTKAIDLGIIVLDSATPSGEYSSSKLMEDKNTLLLAKTDPDIGLLTITNKYQSDALEISQARASKDLELANSEGLLRGLETEVIAVREAVLVSKREKSKTQADILNTQTLNTNDLQKNIQEAETNIIAIQSELNAAKRTMDSLTTGVFSNEIRAPHAGVITRRSISTGGSVEIGQSVFDIVNNKNQTLYVRFNLPENVLENIKVGTEIEFYSIQNPNEKQKAVIERYADVIDTSEKTTRIEARILNKDGAMKIGSTVRVVVPSDTLNLQVLKSSINQDDSGKQFVFLSNDGILKKQFVKTGQSLGNYIQISFGIQEHDLIVLDATNPLLKDALLIEPVTSDIGAVSPDTSEGELVEHDGHDH